MRTALLAALVMAGCSSDSSWGGGGGGGWGGGGGGGAPGPGGGPFGSCQRDSDCNPAAGSGVDAGSAGSGTGQVCARDGACVPAADVQTVHVTWTILGQAAGSATCASVPSLELNFSQQGAGGGYGYGYAPVPCVEGKFTIDKLETTYNYVQLDVEYQGGGSGAPIPPGGGTVALNLPY
jgi:hypothetical protein